MTLCHRLCLLSKDLHLLCLYDLAAAECVRITHQNLLFSLETHGVIRNGVVAATACALRSTEAIVSKAFAVKLEAT